MFYATVARKATPKSRFRKIIAARQKRKQCSINPRKLDSQPKQESKTAAQV